MKDDKENFSQLRRKDVDLMSKNIDLNHRLNVLNDEVDACKTHVERSANHSSTNLNFLLNSVRSNGLAERTPNKSMTLVSIPAKRKSPVNFALTPPRMYQIQDTRKNNARLNESSVMKELMVFHTIQLVKRIMELVAQEIANNDGIEISLDSEEKDECDLESIDAKNPMQKTVMLKPENLIDDYKPTHKLDRQHICGERCVCEFEKNPQIFEHDPLKRPLLAGWARKLTGICFYIAPCGRSFNTLEATYKYLYTTKSKLTIDCFSFSSKIECMKEVIGYNDTNNKYLLNDLIPGDCAEKESQIPVVPIANNLPHFGEFKEYVMRNRRNSRSKRVPSYLNDTANNPFRTGCDCGDDCSDKSKCSCWRLTLDGSKPSKLCIGYNFKRLKGRVGTGIYECNPSCKCSRQCLNRVVSAKIEQKLELFETMDRGYGVRCQTDLPKGTFIACYFGDILHGRTADKRAMKNGGPFHGDEYFMQMDHIEMAEQYKDGYESNASEIDENINVKNGAPSEQAEVNQRATLFGQDAVEFVVDGRYRGNIARFFNHSCEPNLFAQTVFVDTHDLRFPWLSFFTLHDIKAGTEMVWDYGYQIGSIFGREIPCRCGAENCQKRLL